MKKIILIMFILLFSLNFVASVKPTQVINNGCEIRFPQVTNLIQNQDVKYHTHVINTTTGSNNRLTNDSTNCFIHLYNSSGHILEKDLDFDDNLLEWELLILGGNFSQQGDFAFYVECNSSDSICAVSGMYTVSSTGQELTEAKSILYIGLLSILVLLFIVNLIAIPLLPSRDNHDEDGILISINQLKYIRPILYVTAYFLLISITFISSNIALAYMGTTLIGDLLFNIFYIMMALSVPMVVIWFIYIFYSIFQDKKMKQYIERGLIDEKI